jgi:hypothetical protein
MLKTKRLSKSKTVCDSFIIGYHFNSPEGYGKITLDRRYTSKEIIIIPKVDITLTPSERIELWEKADTAIRLTMFIAHQYRDA